MDQFRFFSYEPSLQFGYCEIRPAGACGQPTSIRGGGYSLRARKLPRILHNPNQQPDNTRLRGRPDAFSRCSTANDSCTLLLLADTRIILVRRTLAQRLTISKDGDVDFRVALYGACPRYALAVEVSDPFLAVQGTTRYFDDPERPHVATVDAAALKCDTLGAILIILVPQPSNDPNDPLVELAIMERDVILIILSITSVFATSLGPILAANTLTLSLVFESPVTQIAVLTRYFLLGVGVAGILAVPSARVWGKRHLFIFGTVLLIGTSAWGGASRSYNSLLAARIFQRIATAPFKALVNAAVGDLYFIHQRGKRMALTNLSVFGGAFFTPILVGKITYTIGWP